MTDDAAIDSAILTRLGACAAGGSISPDDVAKALTPEWQGLLRRVRQRALVLAGAGHIDILRKGRPVPAAEVRGVIRLRLKREPA